MHTLEIWGRSWERLCILTIMASASELASGQVTEKGCEEATQRFTHRERERGGGAECESESDRMYWWNVQSLSVGSSGNAMNCNVFMYVLVDCRTYVTIIKQRIIETLFIASFIIEVDILRVLCSMHNLCHALHWTIYIYIYAIRSIHSLGCT